MADEQSSPCCTRRGLAVVDSLADVTFSVETPLAEEPRRLLDSCYLCRKPLRISSDVFMYRGDTPFCSEDCRQEQIDLDDARNWELSYCRRVHRRRASVLGASPSAQPKAAVAS